MKPFRKIAIGSVLPTCVMGEALERETDHDHDHDAKDETMRSLLVAYLASPRGAMFAVRSTERGDA